MMKDPQIKTGLSILQLFLLSRELKITSGGENKVDQEARDYIETVLFDEMETNIRQVRKNIYTALPYGFSAQEIVYSLRNDGRIGLKGIYPIHRSTLDHAEAFHYTKDGELTHLEQSLEKGAGKGNKINIDKILLYSFDMEFDNPEGQSILNEVYDNVFIKQRILKWLAIFLQKHASPFLVSKLGEFNTKFREVMLQQLEEVKDGRTQMTIGKDDEVQIIESNNKGESFFNSLQYHDAIIFRRFFIGTLLLGQLDTSGSYAQSESQISVTKLLLDGIHEEIGGRLQEFTDRLVEYNFSHAASPKIFFEKFEDKDILGLLDSLKPYFDGGYLDPDASWFTEALSTIIRDVTGVEVKPDDLLWNAELDPEHSDLEEDTGNEELIGDLESILPPK